MANCPYCVRQGFGPWVETAPRDEGRSVFTMLDCSLSVLCLLKQKFVTVTVLSWYDCGTAVVILLLSLRPFCYSSLVDLYSLMRSLRSPKYIRVGRPTSYRCVGIVWHFYAGVGSALVLRLGFNIIQHPPCWGDTQYGEKDPHNPFPLHKETSATSQGLWRESRLARACHMLKDFLLFLTHVVAAFSAMHTSDLLQDGTRRPVCKVDNLM